MWPTWSKKRFIDLVLLSTIPKPGLQSLTCGILIAIRSFDILVHQVSIEK